MLDSSSRAHHTDRSIFKRTLDGRIINKRSMLNRLVDIPRCRPLLTHLLQTQFARTCDTYCNYSSATSLSDGITIGDESSALFCGQQSQSSAAVENGIRVAFQDPPHNPTHDAAQTNDSLDGLEESVVSSDGTSKCTLGARVRKVIDKKSTDSIGGWVSSSNRVRQGKPSVKVKRKSGWRETSWKAVKPDKVMIDAYFVSLGSWLHNDKGDDSGFAHQGGEALPQNSEATPRNSKVTPESAALSPEFSKTGFEQFDHRWFFRISRLLHGHKVHIPMTPHIASFLSRHAGVRTRTTAKAGQLQKPLSNNLLWQETALWCLQRSPMVAMKLLINTLNGPFRPPRTIVAECLNFLARHYLYNVSRPGTHALNTLWHLTGKFIERDDVNDLRTYTIPESLVRLILLYCHNHGALNLYKRLSTNRVVLHTYQMLHFLERFVHMRRYDLCLPLLAAISSTGFSLAHPQVQGLCSKLLRIRWDVKEPYALSSWILTRMLELGIQPNTVMYNAMVQNAIEAHDFDTVLELYGFAKRSQFGIDSQTRGLMLKAAKISGNVEMLNIVLREASVDPEVVKDARLAGTILHIIGVFSLDNEYPSMLDFYKRNFDLRPLQELRICGPNTESTTGTESRPIQPDHWVLGQMVAAYNKLPRASDDLISRYNIYHDLVRRNHPLVAPLAQQSEYVANSFIRAFGRELKTLPFCITVIKHMLENPPSPSQAAYAAPTVRTWNILAASYFRHNQAIAAEKVVSMMYERGLEPNIVTRNTMVQGYSALQDVDSAVEAVRHMEAAGYEVDDFTLKGLGKIWDRNRLLETLKKSMSEEGSAERESQDVFGLLPLVDANSTGKDENIPKENVNFTVEEKN